MIKKYLINFIGLVMFSLMAAPIVLTIFMSLMGIEIESIKEALFQGNQISLVDMIPSLPTLKQYFTVLVNRYDILRFFWNSSLIVLPIVLGQLVISVCAAYGFAFFNFRFKSLYFTLYIIAMLLPFQVTLVPNFILAVKSGLIGTSLSIILPGMFSTFGTFFLYQFMKTIPKSLVEAASIDGAGHLTILTKVIIPIAKPFIVSLIVLVFIDNWNLVEQPLIMLNHSESYPLSLVLANAGEHDFDVAFAVSVVYFIPPMLLYLASTEHLQSGMKSMSLK